MNPDQQRVTIAKACGWTGFDPDNIPDCLQFTARNTDGKWGLIPDYPNDLNAMRDAVLSLNGLRASPTTGREYPADALDHYLHVLYNVVHKRPPDAYCHWSDFGDSRDMFIPTAAQQAEAFLRTLGLWQDNPPAP